MHTFTRLLLFLLRLSARVSSRPAVTMNSTTLRISFHRNHPANRRKKNGFISSRNCLKTNNFLRRRDDMNPFFFFHFFFDFSNKTHLQVLALQRRYIAIFFSLVTYRTNIIQRTLFVRFLSYFFSSL